MRPWFKVRLYRMRRRVASRRAARHVAAVRRRVQAHVARVNTGSQDARQRAESRGAARHRIRCERDFRLDNFGSPSPNVSLPYLDRGLDDFER